MARYTIAFLPAIQRDLFLSRAIRRFDDKPELVDTLHVEWGDMSVNFETDQPVTAVSVEVEESISLVSFTARLESVLDCGAKAEGATEWVLKFSAPLSNYGQPDVVRRLLCDKVASLDASTGETIGVLKIKRRSVAVGHAKVRLVPAENLLQVVARHSTAQGLKSVWKSVLWRLRPQYPSNGGKGVAATAVTSVTSVSPVVSAILAPCVRVTATRGTGYDNDFDSAAGWLSEHGLEVDLSRDIDVQLSLLFVEGDLYYSCKSAKYYAKVVLRTLPAGKPAGILISGNAIEIAEQQRRKALVAMRSLSDWLGLGWQLPAE